MELWIVGGFIFFFIILFIVIENAVRIGIDTSQTSKMIKKILDIQMKDNDKK